MGPEMQEGAPAHFFLESFVDVRDADLEGELLELYRQVHRVERDIRRYGQRDGREVEQAPDSRRHQLIRNLLRRLRRNGQDPQADVELRDCLRQLPERLDGKEPVLLAHLRLIRIKDRRETKTLLLK